MVEVKRESKWWLEKKIEKSQDQRSVDLASPGRARLERVVQGKKMYKI